MATVSETVPQALQSEVDAALAWFNETHTNDFEVTGIIDPEVALAADSPRELKLVLCGGNSCEQRSFQVRPVDGGFAIDLVPHAGETETGSIPEEIQAELDPPPGARRDWLASTLGRHAFVVLVFYRGFW